MKRNLIALAALGLFTFGCAESPTSTQADLDATPDFARRSPVVHQVSVGGADVCEALGFPTGCDANLSLTASEMADGSVSGQWQDTFAGGGEGLHISIDCLNVVGGNSAVIGGVITKGTAGGVDVSGQRALTAVMDNGTSNNDPADQLSFSFFPFPNLSCTDLTPGDFPLFDLTNGQVTVK
jgi:hypothetical protein